MPLTLVDSSVLLDILTRDEEWYRWSSWALVEAFVRGGVAINPIIYSEVSVRFKTEGELDSLLGVTADFQRLDLPWTAAFLAGKCFKDYKNRGGIRRSPLPDFYIGAHAMVLGLVLLTRDPSRYRTYFEKLQIQAPS